MAVRKEEHNIYQGMCIIFLYAWLAIKAFSYPSKNFVLHLHSNELEREQVGASMLSTLFITFTVVSDCGFKFNKYCSM